MHDVESLHVAQHAVETVMMTIMMMIDDCIYNVESLHVQQHAAGTLATTSALL